MDVQPFKCKQNLWEGRLQRKVCSRLGRQWARSPDEFCKVEEVFFSSNSWTFAYQKDKTPASPQIHIYPFQTLAKAKRISSFLACILYQSHFPSGSPKHWRTCKCMVTKEISCNLGLGGGGGCLQPTLFSLYKNSLGNFLVPQGDRESKEQKQHYPLVAAKQYGTKFWEIQKGTH